MNFNETQQDLLDRLDFAIQQGEYRNGISEATTQEICQAFGGDALWSLHGIGGTRIVITHPEKELSILKIAFTENGILGNTDEYNDYHAAPDDVKAFLAEPGELFADGMILEMDYYEAFTEEHQLDDYKEELDNILSHIRFVNYQDPPYHHSFGVDDGGILALLDYGETEKFEVIIRPDTDIKTLVGKNLAILDVTNSVDLHLRVDSETSVTYSFVDTDENTQDQPITTTLVLAYDDVEGVHDWSFQTPFGSQYFLHQFEAPRNTNQAISGENQT